MVKVEVEPCDLIITRVIYYCVLYVYVVTYSNDLLIYFAVGANVVTDDPETLLGAKLCIQFLIDALRLLTQFATPAQGASIGVAATAVKFGGAIKV